MTVSSTDIAAPLVVPLALPRKKPARPLPPPVRFADVPHRARTLRDAERARAIVLAPVVHEPGQLCRVLDSEMETLLALRGAMPPSVAAEAPYQAVVDDQIARAVTLPVRGICVSFPRLAGLTIDGALEGSDARAVRAWMHAARIETRLRLVVLLDELDREVELYAPTALALLVGESSLRHELSSASSFPTPTPPSAVPPVISSECVEDAPAVAFACEPEPEAVPPSLELALPALDLSEEPAVVAACVEPAPIVETLRPPTGPEPSFEAELELDEEALSLAGALASAQHSELPAPVALRSAFEKIFAEEPATKPRPTALERERDREREIERAAAERAREHAAAERVAAERIAAERAARLVNLATHRAHSLDLDAARGPKPVAVVEKLFVERYVPLMGAMARGETDDAIASIVDTWRSSFAESYEAAYEAIRVTAKRPTMVMDAPEAAHRIARLASARSVKLVMVDSMSYDLGARVAARISGALHKRAVLVEKNLLWAALPSTTPTQTHLLSRGVDGLRDQPGPTSDPDITRGRSVSTLRRERLGGREVIKLDLVEARLRGQGAAYEERLESVADEVAEILVKLLDSLPPRTLAYVFGDHGFVLHGIAGGGTSAATQGGSTPEEVLVPGFGYLVDAVQ